jgi:hypothetical protein
VWIRQKKRCFWRLIETLENNFIFEFLVLNLFFWRRFTSEKNGWILGQVKTRKTAAPLFLGLAKQGKRLSHYF